MTNKKSTKRALIASVLALVMCVSMLVGSTYAWFTDSVSSVNNVIKSGNLDVELEYSTDGENWVAVDDETSIFSDNTLWEPGHTEAVALRIKNVGTLALKYELNTNVYLEEEGTNVYGEEFLLSDYLKVGYSAVQEDGVVGDIYMGLLLGDRTKITDANGVVPMDFVGFNKVANIPTPSLEPGAAHVTVLAITMPTTVGNEANYMTGTAAPYIRFGINVYATQFTYEADSFGTDYDADATYDYLPSATVTDNGPVTVAVESLFGDWFFVDENGNNANRLPAYDLDAAFTFVPNKAADSIAADYYDEWIADYEVTSSVDLPDGAAVLAGQYNANSSSWQAFKTPAVEAGVANRLLGSQGFDLTYDQCVTFVEKFNCGIKDIDLPAGAEITVALKIYKQADDGTVLMEHTVGVFKYVAE